MSKSLKISSILISLIILLFLVIPFLIPTDNYKNTIQNEVKKVTGRDLKIDGKMSLSLLPLPTVTLDNITLSNIEGGKAPFIFKTKQAKVSLNIMPLLTGNISVSSVELDHPEINLEILNTGKANWEFKRDNDVSGGNNQDAAKPSKNKFSIGKIFIKQGTIHYLKNGDEKIIENIDLEATIKSLQGPLDFKTSFDALGKKLNINGNIKEIKDDIIPVNAELKIQNDTLNIDGDYSSKINSFSGKVSLQTNLKNYAENLPAGLQKELKLTSKVLTDSAKVDLDEIVLTSGVIKGVGNASYSIDHGTTNLNLKLNPGEVNAILKTDKADSNQFQGYINVSSNSLTAFTDALEIKNDQLNSLGNQKISFHANTTYNENNIVFKDLALMLADATLNGAFNYNNKDKGLNYDLKASNLGTFAKLGNFKLPTNISNASFKGSTVINKNSYKINTDIIAGNATININGTVDAEKAIKPNLKIRATGNNLSQSLNQLLAANVNNLGKFTILLDVIGDVSESLKLTLNPSSISSVKEEIRFKGDSNINFKSSKPVVSTNLNLSSVNLDNFGNSSNQPKNRTGNSNNSGINSNAGLHWSHDKIDLKFLQGFDLSANVNIQRIFKGSLVFDNVVLKTNLLNGVLDISSLNGNLYGGTLQGNGSISAASSQPISFKATLKNAHLKNVVPEYKKFKITSGVFNLNLDIKSKGESQLQYVQNLSGNIDFNGSNGRLSGIDLQKITNSFNNIKGWEGIFNVLDSSLSGGETDFKTLKGALIINNGVAQLKDVVLEAQGATADAIGNIDLPKYSLDVWSSMTVSVKNLPPFKAHFYGPIDNPAHQIDAKALQTNVMQNVVTNVLDGIGQGKKKPGDILRSVIGGNETEPRNAPATEETTKEKPVKAKPEDLLKQGLQNLFKN